MNLSFTWLNILILFGAFQALLFTVVLLFQKTTASKFLAAFVVIFAYNGIETFNWSAGLNHFIFDVFAFVLIFAAGPALYLHVKSTVSPHVTISRKETFAHFSVFLFQFATRVAAMGYHLLYINKVVDNETTFLNSISFSWTKAEPVSMIMFAGYVIASVRLFHKTTASSILHFTSKPKTKIEWIWIRALLVWSALIAVAWALTLGSSLIVPLDGPNYYPIELLLVGFTYWLTLNGYHKIKLIRTQKRETEVIQPVAPDQARAFLDELMKAMEARKLYLDPKLSLDKLSRETGIPGKMISAVLNQYQELNFNDFINSYRIKAVCAMLADPTLSQRYTISGIAFECGFNSQATFQRVFKNKMGMSPREYATQILKETA